MFSRPSLHARATDLTFLVKSMYNNTLNLTDQSFKEINAKGGKQGVAYTINVQKTQTPPKP